ncbi:MAG: hypothetical protein FWD68_20685 [Alphaproteobacteria bacterium]|nr:hypothetical protein [Alphaproteobacteria bacterium]
MAESPESPDSGGQPSLVAASQASAKRSGHVALLLMGTIAVGTAAYGLMPKSRCVPIPRGTASPASPERNANGATGAKADAPRQDASVKPDAGTAASPALNAGTGTDVAANPALNAGMSADTAAIPASGTATGADTAANPAPSTNASAETAGSAAPNADTAAKLASNTGTSADAAAKPGANASLDTDTDCVEDQSAGKWSSRSRYYGSQGYSDYWYSRSRYYYGGNSGRSSNGYGRGQSSGGGAWGYSPSTGSSHSGGGVGRGGFGGSGHSFSGG